MSWLQLLVLVHVLSAIIGIGPTYFGHVLMRRNQTVAEYRSALQITKYLDFFPKIGGSIAVLSGLGLFFAGSYGTFTQLWLLGSLILFVLIQIIVLGFITPAMGKLRQWLLIPANERLQQFPAEQQHIVNRISNLFYAASTLGVTLFILMIMKP